MGILLGICRAGWAYNWVFVGRVSSWLCLSGRVGILLGTVGS